MTDRIQTCHCCGHVTVVRAPNGAQPLEHEALAQLARDLDGCPEDLWRLLSAMWTTASPALDGAAGRIVEELGGCRSSVSSRFHRAGLPSLATYFTHVTIARAARLYERPEMSVARIALELDASSAQAFGRTIRIHTGQTALAFFAAHTGAQAFDAYRERLILPHLDVLRRFAPLARVKAPAIGRRAVLQRVG